ncbi:MAG: HypC/HybG/HupF family hydrogenase formation chaperone [Clostridiales bacterium]|nr:HypC/HybG/HupF family hydrogenase formation chaperone [Clostridiales bacterium]
MCVAYPGKVIGVEGRTAEVDFGGNVARVNVGLVNVAIGEYVLVHAGMAIEAMDAEKARGILEAWELVLEA